MTTSSNRNIILGIKADFDFCQNAVKSIFRDDNFINKLKYEKNLVKDNS
jgi:hypothetical protein